MEFKPKNKRNVSLGADSAYTGATQQQAKGKGGEDPPLFIYIIY
jgi:hypothetical protein